MILVEVKICMSPQLTKILVKDVLNIKPVLSGTNCLKFQRIIYLSEILLEDQKVFLQSTNIS